MAISRTKDHPVVDILLATYNGGDYLPELLDSIVSQTYVNWRLIVRDDGSADDSQAIIRAYRDRHAEKIKIINNGSSHLGACDGFGRLMAWSTAEYIMFCDQDDVWLEDKVETLLSALIDLENKCGKNTPLLIHSDLAVTDDRLQVIAESFWRYQHLLPCLASTFPRLLMQNVVTGSATIINRAANDRALPIPTEAIMHDWWLALVVSAFGCVRHLPRSTVLYRQHTRNVAGAKQWGLRYIFARLLSLVMTKDLKSSVAGSIRQARAFFECYQKELEPEHYAAAYALAHLDAMGPVAKRQTIWRHRLLKNGFVRNSALFIVI